MPRLAVYTYGLLREPWGHPGVAGFEAAAGGVFGAAQGAPGFLEQHDEDDAGPPWVAVEDRPRLASTLTVWRGLEDLFEFTYRADHGAAFRRRREWFPEMEQPSYVLWWVEDGERASFVEAVRRVVTLHERGPSPRAFTLREPFDASGRGLPSVASSRRSAR